MKSILFGFYFFSLIKQSLLDLVGCVFFVFLGCDWGWELYTDLIGRKGGEKQVLRAWLMDSEGGKAG